MSSGRRCGRLQYFVEQNTRRSLGPSLRDALTQDGITHEKESRLAILHHGNELGSGLARIERHHDCAFGHERQVNRSPADGIGREERTAIARLQAGAAQITAHTLDLFEQFASRQADKFFAANFPQDDTALRSFQLRENIFEKVEHEVSTNRGKRSG